MKVRGPKHLLVILEAVSFITDEQIAGRVTLEPLCVKPEGLVGHNQHLRKEAAYSSVPHDSRMLFSRKKRCHTTACSPWHSCVD